MNIIEKLVVNNFGSPVTLTLKGDTFSCMITRQGQEDAAVGNQVITNITVLFDKDDLIPFAKYVFSTTPNDIQYLISHGNKDVINGIYPPDSHSVYRTNTWKEGFAKAKEYFLTQLKIYDDLVQQRKNALIEAEK